MKLFNDHLNDETEVIGVRAGGLGDLHTLSSDSVGVKVRGKSMKQNFFTVASDLHALA